MIGSILKVLAYRQAPRTTFGLLHPEVAFQMAKMQYDFHHAYAPRVAAIAAAAVALPLGIILGRAIERRASQSRSLHASAGRRPMRRATSQSVGLASLSRTSHRRNAAVEATSPIV